MSIMMMVAHDLVERGKNSTHSERARKPLVSEGTPADPVLFGASSHAYARRRAVPLETLSRARGSEGSALPK